MKNNSKLFTSSESHIRKMPTKNYGSFSTNFAKNKLNNNNTRNEVRDSIGNILEALYKKKEKIIHSDRNKKNNNYIGRSLFENDKIENEEKKK